VTILNTITQPTIWLRVQIFYFSGWPEIIAGYEYTDKKPFTNVYLTGLVRDKQRRKMSKSLGNSSDPLDLIEKFGADGVRVGLLLSALQETISCLMKNCVTKVKRLPIKFGMRLN
jgi:valyl-tRNA synthetase